ncbi:hypothetical protein HPP92_005290 [Vanilla planifolia]|uniref:Uncharacterized protein n=1 Tax=Vanilla planifolia TaxID=51239 RepID=A0A835RT75_VANPL|nr:hypothetical protein HPP92_005290 [Vanilla planifolia]
MASWLKVAEDLLEVVDRRAKLVVSELSDEQSDLQTSASNEAAVKTRKKLIAQKDPPRKPVNRSGKGTETDPRQKNTLSEPSLKASKDESNYGSAPDVASNHTSETSSELPPTSVKVIGISDSSHAEVTETVQVETVDSILERTLSPLNSEASEKLNGYHLADARSQGSTVIVDENLASDTQQERETTQNQNLDGQVNEENPLPALSQNTSKQVDNKADSFLMNVQDQLDEAQGLLKSAVSTGQSKEARLAKVCTGLSSRLQEYKSENSQLEELLVAERELSSSYEVRIKQLQQDLSALKAETATVEANMAESLSAKNAEIEFLVGTVDALKKQLSNSEGRLYLYRKTWKGL